MLPMTAQLRIAEPRDVEAIVGLVRELAEFEHLSDGLKLTSGALTRHLFAARPVIEAVVAEVDGTLVAYALFFTNYSSFLGQPGLYLEDLYVQPAHRGTGVGQALLRHLASLAVAREYGRFEWSVLDWNEQAIGFYMRMGASVLPDWRVCRVTGDALSRLASPD